MNRMLVVVFDNEKTAETGAHALRKLDADGSISLYAMDVIVKDAKGKVSVKEHTGQGPVGTGVGLAVGSLVGLLVGPAAIVLGAVTGTLIGLIRDLWASGVGLDFVGEAERVLTPGKVALVAEVEEEWVIPVDAAMAHTGGVVYRRTREAVEDAEISRDITALKSEMTSLQTEVKHASAAAKASLVTKTAAVKTKLDEAVKRASDSVHTMEQEAAAKAAAIKSQLTKSKGEAKVALEARKARVEAAYKTRSAKLSKAWGLTKEALAA